MKKEEEIFELLKTNRKLGIEELYKNYSKLVYGVIYSILKIQMKQKMYYKMYLLKYLN